MVLIESNIRQHASNTLQEFLEGRYKGAFSLAAINMVFSQLAAFSIRASTLVSNQFPITTAAFNWDNITPHSSLQWHDCYNDFKCARLQVPMDWHGNTTAANETVDLAVIKLEATVPVTDPTYGGLVFFNPGGPGGSGVGQILKGGHAFRTILSAGPGQQGKNFDVISFDPRGVNNSRPILTCFENHIEAAQWEIEKRAEGYIGDSDTSFDNLWARLESYADGCSQRDEAIKHHMSSAPVARDVVELFEKHGEWREEQARKSSKDVSQAVVERLRYRQGQELIQYWGFSYGSILGAHLAAMFPERIARLVIDGVADSHDYMAGGWTTNLQDTDMIFVKLAEYCWLGGKKHCSLWNPDGPAAIVDDIVRILNHFRHNPIGVPGGVSKGPGIVNYHDYETYVREAIYHSLVTFPKIIDVLEEIVSGNGTTLANIKASQLPPLGVPLSSQCITDGPYSAACLKPAMSFLQDATSAVICSDGLPRLDSKEEYKDYASTLMSQSSLIGASWAEIQLPCTAWHARPAWRYDGDFTAKTASPVLLIGNTYDPVTPLRNTFTMARGFEGARILHQNSEGHCSYASPSMCTGKAIRNYFQTGKLPIVQGDTAFCDADLLPLHGYKKGALPGLPDGETDIELWHALLHTNQVFVP